ncbi:pyridoxal-phosphate dependent enzyme [Streptosporangium sp. G11]|uniref:pyridoxal-phosphate dependent enzyme n=1 Tax=Streptosporangium sp. G11 TaxID=3436926 RepID=UPI003EBF8D92
MTLDISTSPPAAPAGPFPEHAGQTPLIEARGLVPGVRVLIKDETRYASGSHKEPAARAVVRHALEAGYRDVVVATCGNYGRAAAAAGAAAGLAVTVVLPSGWSDGGAAMRALGARVVLVDGSYEEAVDASRRIAAERGALDGNVDGPCEPQVLAGHGEVVDALAAELDGPPHTVWLPVGNGTTAIAVHRRLVALGWPTRIVGVGSAGNNPIVTSWPGEYLPLAPDAVATTDHNQPLVNWHALQGAAAMDAIRSGGGEVLGASDAELLRARDALAVHGPTPTAAGAVALAGLLGRATTLDAGSTHVVVLSGR